MFRLKYSLQDEADDDQTAGPAPGETTKKPGLDDIDETDRGDTVSADVAALPEDEEGDVPAKTAAELGAEEIAKAEKKAADDAAAAELADDPVAAKKAADDAVAAKKAADDAAAAAKPAAKTPGGKQIPKHRYDAAQVARRSADARAAAAEAKLEALQALQDQAPPAGTTTTPAAAPSPLDEQIEALDKKVDDLTEEGKADEAREARRELRALERQQISEEASASAQAVATESVEQGDLRTAIENIEDAIPALNPDNVDAFDKDLSDNVNELADAFEANGHSPAAALYKAIDFAIPASADEETDGAELPANERVEKNIDAATRQPSKLDDASKTSLNSGEAGLRAGKVDVMEMSEKRFEEFVSDEEQEKIARGDFVGA